MKKAKQAPADLLSPRDLAPFLAACAGRRWYALWLLVVCTGMRRGEVLGLRLVDLDLQAVDDLGASAPRVHVRRQLQRIGANTIEMPPKAGSRRALRIPHFVASALAAHLETRELERLEAEDEWRESGRVFTTGVGTAIEPRNLLREFEAVRSAIGRPDLRLHDLRHSAATILHTAGVPEQAIAKLLGHSDAGTTRRIYTHVANDQERAAADTFDGLLGKPNIATRFATQTEKAGMAPGLKVAKSLAN